MFKKIHYINKILSRALKNLYSLKNTVFIELRINFIKSKFKFEHLRLYFKNLCPVGRRPNIYHEGGKIRNLFCSIIESF